jgi:hypothetical protein
MQANDQRAECGSPTTATHLLHIRLAVVHGPEPRVVLLSRRRHVALPPVALLKGADFRVTLRGIFALLLEAELCYIAGGSKRIRGSMADYADLEIGLHRRDVATYSVDLRFTRPKDDADVRPKQGTVQFDRDRLLTLAGDLTAYGKLLSDSLFADADLKAAFAQARGSLQDGMSLRVRLFIGPTAPELHSLRWETLQDPQTGTPLFTGEEVLLSRYLSSADWRPVRLRPRSDLRALAVIANPSDLAQYELAKVDVAGELARARESLGEIPVEPLASGGAATLNKMVEKLRDGYDILYLVCHGALKGNEPWLWLEADNGGSDKVKGTDLATRLRELAQRPRLVVLASCQSAGSGTGQGAGEEALSALGPLLAEAGIPAVLAMQGKVSMETVAKFMPVFFGELRKDGQIDRAMAVARGAVRERPDSWMPVLFMRLRSGRIWYVPGFADDRPGFEKWPALSGNIRKGSCTPILGPGLLESLIGSPSEIARRWAETYQFPLAPQDREDLPHVAQYLSVNQNPRFPREELAEYLRKELLRRNEGAAAGLQDLGLADLLPKIAAAWRQSHPADPHAVLAKFDFPFYITTNPDSFLESALIAAGKEPRVEICRWNSDLEQLPSIYDKEPDYRPDKEHPLVYHLFGRIEEPSSLVLTEDDYFDFLIGVTGNKDLIPSALRRRLADSALLFLGFRMDDWNFRVLFRSVMNQQGSRRRDGYSHVAAQIDPEEGRILEPERARRYLESYFQGAAISIFWGNVDDFVGELLAQAKQGAK